MKGSEFIYSEDLTVFCMNCSKFLVISAHTNHVFHLISRYPDVRVKFRCTEANADGSLPRSWSTYLCHPGPGRPFPPAGACRDAPSTTATSERSHNSTPSGLKEPSRSVIISDKTHSWDSELFGQTPNVLKRLREGKRHWEEQTVGMGVYSRWCDCIKTNNLAWYHRLHERARKIRTNQ